MSEEKKDQVSPENGSERKEKTETEKTDRNQPADPSSENTEKEQYPEKPEPVTNTETSSGRKTEPAGNGTVPPEKKDHRPQDQKKKEHHGVWKTVLKYVLVFLIAGCGAFAGSYAAVRVSRRQEAEEIRKAVQSFGSQLPSGGDDSENQSSGPALGITIEQTDNGIEIVGFADNSNAESAGLKTGDIITKVDGKTYDSVSEIAGYISSKKVGDKVRVTVKRDNEEKTYRVKLVKKNLSAYSMPDEENGSSDSDSDLPKALPGTDGENSGLQG